MYRARYKVALHLPSSIHPSGVGCIARATKSSSPPWSQPRGNSMVSLVNCHTNATRIGWHLWEIDLRFAPGLPPGWARVLFCLVLKVFCPPFCTKGCRKKDFCCDFLQKEIFLLLRTCQKKSWAELRGVRASLALPASCNQVVA